MLDALELVRNLTAGGFAQVGDALAAFEAGMLARMEPAIEETLASQKMMFARDAPAELVAHINEAARSPGMA